MPPVPSPWSVFRTMGVLTVVLGLTVVGVLGGTTVGLTAAHPGPGADGVYPPASPVDPTAPSFHPRHTGDEGEQSVHHGVNATRDPTNDVNRSASEDPVTTAGVFPFEPTQVDRDPPEDRTPYGIETMYGSPNVVETAGGRGVDVAVLDSGVDRDHPDLIDRVEMCRDYSGPGVRRDSCTDRDGHGTHIAGTIAATGGENGTGIFGVAPEADLWVFKVCARDGNCDSADVAEAIEDAGREGAEVIVLSIGGERTPAVQRALTGAEQRGALLVGAAGNTGPDLETVEHPASDPAVVAVGAVERTNGVDVRSTSYRVPEFSSRGVNDTGLKRQEGYLEVTAPGTDVLSTWVGGGYHVLSGTSVAVPHVAGVAARLWSSTDDRDGDGRRNDDVRRALGNRAATFDVTRGLHAKRGYDPAAGVGVPRIVTPQVTIGLNPLIPTVGEPVSLTADRVGSGPTTIASYRWDLESDGLVDIIGADVETTFQSAGEQPVTLRTVDDAGVVSETTVEIRVNAPPIADYVYAPEVPLAGEEIRFTAIGSGDPDGRVQSFTWDVDEDGGADSTGPTATATFPDPGRYPITLTVLDDVGAERSATKEVLVNDRPIVEVPTTVRATAGEKVVLRARVTDSVGETTVTWHFPTGRRAVGPEVTSTFPPGQFPVRVNVVDEYGASTDAIVTVVVSTQSTGADTTTRTPTEPPGLPLDGFTATTVVLALVVVYLAGRWRGRRR